MVPAATSESEPKQAHRSPHQNEDPDHDHPTGKTHLAWEVHPSPNADARTSAGTVHPSTPYGRGHSTQPGARGPGGDNLRVRGQDSGPRRRRTPPTAQKCPRRRRTSPLGASGPMGRRYPPALRRLPPHHRAQPPRAPAQATGLTSPHSLFGGLQPPTRTIFFTTLPDDAPPRSSHGAAAPRQHAGHLPPLEKSSIAT